MITQQHFLLFCYGAVVDLVVPEKRVMSISTKSVHTDCLRVVTSERHCYQHQSWTISTVNRLTGLEIGADKI